MLMADRQIALILIIYQTLYITTQPTLIQHVRVSAKLHMFSIDVDAETSLITVSNILNKYNMKILLCCSIKFQSNKYI